MQSVTSMQKQLEQTNALNASLLDAIYDFDNSALDLALKKGANVNAIGINWEQRDEPTSMSPLGLAVKIGNLYAVEQLLINNADVYGKTETGGSIIWEASKRGDDRIVKAILRKFPRLAEVTFNDEKEILNRNLLHNLIFSLYPYSVIQDGSWENNNKDLRLLLIDYFDEKSVQLPQHPLTVAYYGNLDMVKVLDSFHPRLVTMKTKAGFTPLDVVNNPREFKQYFYDASKKGAIQCLTEDSDPNPHILKFKIHIRNRLDAKEFPVTVIFDFSKLQAALQKMAESLPDFQIIQTVHEVKNQISMVNGDLGQRLIQVQDKLSTVQGQVGGLAIVVKRHADLVGVDDLEDFNNFLANIENRKNAKAFFKHVEVGLSAFHVYCTNVKGGGTVKSGSLDFVATILDVSSNLVGSIPVAGSILEKLVNVASAGVKKVDEARETNIAHSVAKLGTITDMVPIFKEVARQLTECYFQPLEEILATAEEAKEQYNKFQKTIEKGKKLLLKEQPLSPAQQLAACAVMYIIDEVLVNSAKLKEENTQKQLTAILLDSVIGHEASKSEGLRKFWDKMLSTIQREGLRTKSGAIINPVDILTRSGFIFDNHFYTGKGLEPVNFGWRHVKTIELIKNFELNEISAPTKLPLILPTFKQNPPVNPELLPEIYGTNSVEGTRILTYSFDHAHSQTSVVVPTVPNGNSKTLSNLVTTC